MRFESEKMNPAAIADVFRSLDRELWILTAADGELRAGLLLTSVVSASLAPETPRVLIQISCQHSTWSVLERANRFVLHTVAATQAERAWLFGLESSRAVDKFAGLPVVVTNTGGARLSDAPSWLECRVEARWDAGGRTVYLADVVDGGRTSDEPPLTVRRLMASAAPHQVQRLREKMRADAVVEAEAIRDWRSGVRVEPNA